MTETANSESSESGARANDVGAVRGTERRDTHAKMSFLFAFAISSLVIVFSRTIVEKIYGNKGQKTL